MIFKKGGRLTKKTVPFDVSAKKEMAELHGALFPSFVGSAADFSINFPFSCSFCKGCGIDEQDGNLYNKRIKNFSLSQKKSKRIS